MAALPFHPAFGHTSTITSMSALRPIIVALLCWFAVPCALAAQASGRPAPDSQQSPPRSTLLKPARVFDGVTAEPHAGWVVLVTGDKIAAVGPETEMRPPAGSTTID